MNEIHGLATNNVLMSNAVFLFNSFFGKKNVQIIDPLSSIVRLAIYYYKPVGTKLGISNNVIWFQNPTLIQGAIRTIYRDRKTDLHNLYQPIQKACQWYLIENCDSRMIHIFKLAKNGLVKLKKTYKHFPLVCHCISYYVDVIEDNLKRVGAGDADSDSSGNSLTPIEFVEDFDPDDNDVKLLQESIRESIIVKEKLDSGLALKLKNVWTRNKINTIFSIFQEITLLKEESDIKGITSLVESLEEFLNPIDNKVQNIIKNINL